jgi:hypothetical protein
MIEKVLTLMTLVFVLLATVLILDGIVESLVR